MISIVIVVVIAIEIPTLDIRYWMFGGSLFHAFYVRKNVNYTINDSLFQRGKKNPFLTDGTNTSINFPINSTKPANRGYFSRILINSDFDSNGRFYHYPF